MSLPFVQVGGRNPELLVTAINLAWNTPGERPGTNFQKIAYVDGQSQGVFAEYPMRAASVKETEKGDTEPRDFNDAFVVSVNCKAGRIDGPSELLPIDPTRDMYGLLKDAAPDIIAQGDKIWDRRLAKKINENGVCYDGRPFFDTAHSSNKARPGAPPYTNDLINTDLDEAGLVEALQQMMLIPGFDETPINADLGIPIILVPTWELKLKADKLINAGLIAKVLGTSAASESTQLVGVATTVLMPELVDPNIPESRKRWYLLNVRSNRRRAFIVRNPVKPVFHLTGPTDHVAVERNARAAFYWASGGAGYGLPQLAIRATL